MREAHLLQQSAALGECVVLISAFAWPMPTSTVPHCADTCGGGGGGGA